MGLFGKPQDDNSKNETKESASFKRLQGKQNIKELFFQKLNEVLSKNPSVLISQLPEKIGFTKEQIDEIKQVFSKGELWKILNEIPGVEFFGAHYTRKPSFQGLRYCVAQMVRHNVQRMQF